MRIKGRLFFYLLRISITLGIICLIGFAFALMEQTKRYPSLFLLTWILPLLIFIIILNDRKSLELIINYNFPKFIYYLPLILTILISWAFSNNESILTIYFDEFSSWYGAILRMVWEYLSVVLIIGVPLITGILAYRLADMADDNKFKHFIKFRCPICNSGLGYHHIIPGVDNCFECTHCVTYFTFSCMKAKDLEE